jgi:putative transposase
MSHAHRCPVGGQASNQGIWAGGPNPGPRVDRSFSRHHRRAVSRIYPESRAQAEAQPLSRPRASRHPLQSYPLVRELAADNIPVAVTCRVLAFSKQAFYKWCANPVSQRDWDDAHLINAAVNIHHDDPAFGYRFIADQLHERGLTAGENRVARLCSQQRIWSVFAKKRGLNRKAGPPVHDDLVDRQFTAPTPNAVWSTDITEHPTAEGKLYLCAIKDLHSSRIVGYSMDARMTAALAVTALRNAIALRSPAGTIVHSDRGSQFRSTAFVTALNTHGLTESMGRVGACGDNAAMESFFALLQRNVLDRQRWATREDLRLAIITWIEKTYHRRRRQRRLGRLTPIGIETLTQAAHAA